MIKAALLVLLLTIAGILVFGALLAFESPWSVVITTAVVVFAISAAWQKLCDWDGQ